jgi:hypothetical protein
MDIQWRGDGDLALRREPREPHSLAGEISYNSDVSHVHSTLFHRGRLSERVGRLQEMSR